jgi:ATP-dependent DNA helicase DinG
VNVESLRAILGPGGALARTLPGYEHRPQQLVMAQEIGRALTEEHPLLVEAGTGTGKTLAYLIPAVLSGKKVVVSTGTRTLQEQLYGKDVPLLRQAGVACEAAVLKGISNYVCRRRFAEIGMTEDPDLVRITAWARRTEVGDRAELAGVAEDAPAWRLVTTGPEARLGPKCPYFEPCFVTQARRAAHKAQIVVVNHHLFFADLALRAAYPGAQVLPPYDAVIFDEAHQIEDVATEHFGITVSTLRVLALVRDAKKALADATDVSSPRLIDNLEARADELFALLRDRLAKDSAGVDVRKLAPADLFAEPRRERWFRLDAALEELAAHAHRRASSEEKEDAAAVGRRASALRNDLATLAERHGHEHVHWAETRGRTLLLHASPVDIAPLFARHVTEAVTTVLTSATLSVGGSFSFLRGRLGLGDDLTQELSVESPFDYTQQALLYLPRDLPAPQDPAFGDAVVARTLELLTLTQGRAFVLFTSHRALRHAAEVLRAQLPYPLLVQGENAKAALLASFQATVGSVLLATSSFWEGVDIPGEALSLVVLAKLPFATPDDPLTQARVTRLEEDGHDPFADYHLPRAALALKQGFGRLIRRRDDRGIVAILDHRIVTRSYGRVFLESLPPAPRTSSLEQVRRWW